MATLIAKSLSAHAKLVVTIMRNDVFTKIDSTEVGLHKLNLIQTEVNTVK